MKDCYQKIRRVLLAFKEASNRVGKVDRELQEVLDSQVYIVEELTNTGSKQASLESLIMDFNFTLDQAIRAICVSQDNTP